MQMTNSYRLAFRALSSARRVLAVCHARPDGDAIGSTAAVLLFCRRQGIEAKAFCADPVPPAFAFLPETERFTADPAVFGEGWDAIAVLDCSDLKRIGLPEPNPDLRSLGSGPSPLVRPPSIVAIDHHFSGRPYGDVNVVDPGASSAAELVRETLLSGGVPLDRDLSVCLLAGLGNDTDSLTNPASTGPAFRAAAELLSRGAEWRTVNGLYVRNRSVDSLRLMGPALSRLKSDPLTGLATTAVFPDDGPAGSIDRLTDGLANFLGNTLDEEVILVLKDRGDGTVSGSFRTVGEADTASLAGRLGGGGHRKASGFTVRGRIVEREHGWTVERCPEGE